MKLRTDQNIKTNLIGTKITFHYITYKNNTQLKTKLK